MSGPEPGGLVFPRVEPLPSLAALGTEVPLRAGWRFELEGFEVSFRTGPAGGPPRYVEARYVQPAPASGERSARVEELLHRFRGLRAERDEGDAPARSEWTATVELVELEDGRAAMRALAARHSSEQKQELGGFPAHAGSFADSGELRIELAAGPVVIGFLGPAGSDDRLVRVAHSFLKANAERIGKLPPSEAPRKPKVTRKERRPPRAEVDGPRKDAREPPGTATTSPSREPLENRAQVAHPVATLTADVTVRSLPGTVPRPISGREPVDEAVRDRHLAARARYESGRQYLAMDRPVEALRQLVAALVLDPELDAAREKIRELETRSGVTPADLGLSVPRREGAASPPELESITAGPPPATSPTPDAGTGEPADAEPPATSTTSDAGTNESVDSEPPATLPTPDAGTGEPADAGPPAASTLPGPGPAETLIEPPAITLLHDLEPLPGPESRTARGERPVGPGRRSPAGPRGLLLLPLATAVGFAALLFLLLKRRLGL